MNAAAARPVTHPRRLEKNNIYPCTSGSHLEIFFTLQFVAATENNTVDLSLPAGEQQRVHRVELQKYLAQKQKTGIFLAEDEAHHPIGYVWASERGYVEPWDCKAAPAWVYDLRVDQSARGQGLGQALMQQAELWASREGFDRIGLHVFAGNHAAINLYKKLGYITMECQLQKELDGSASTTVVGNGPYRVHPFQKGTDPSPLVDIWQDSFSRVAQSLYQTPGRLVPERFSTFISNVRFDHPDVETFVACDRQDEFFGFMRLSSADHCGEKVAWISTLQTLPGMDEVAGLLLEHAENWTHRAGYHRLATGKLPQDDHLIRFLQAGYTPSNLYMFKSLQVMQ